MANRDDYITGCIAKMHEHGIPHPMILRFTREAAARPGEYPTFSRDVNETYPAAARLDVRCYEPGILHWEWPDGGGFPPSEREKRASAEWDATEDEPVTTDQEAEAYLRNAFAALEPANGR